MDYPRRYTFRCGFSHSSPVSLPGGEDSGAVVRRDWESGAWWLFRGFPSRHRLDLARSAFNGGRLCSGGGAPALSRFFRRQFAVVVDKCPRSRFGGSRVDFESQASSQTVVVILCWQLSLQVGVVLLVARRAELFFLAKSEVAVWLSGLFELLFADKGQTLVLRVSRSCGRPWTTVPVRASVASTSADRVWFRGFFALLVVVAGYQPVVYPNKSGLCSKLGCWWFQWGSLGFLEFSGACEFQEGGVEVAVLRCLVSGASTGSGSSVPPFRYGPIVVYSEFQALVGICAVAGGRTFVASAWGSQLYRLVTHLLSCSDDDDDDIYCS
ncbi:hypothetical protein HID58_032993 [Brassica napus]|uniref:Uncharacterized protein n=1 Tax=Brassica napus TaxID=3708 RepID=A0ABQ8BXY2_BRANA|nr:hypothetical protein HID58_032993 [Brassica napus]